jgi:hypothetical protein
MAARAARRDPGQVVDSVADMVRSSWLRPLAGGAAIYACITIAAVNTQNVHLLPSVLVLGALLVPVTFIVYLFERLGEQPAIVPALAVTFAAGGSLGVAAASILEYQTLRDLGTLPMLAVGVIEESVKLVVPLWLLARGRFRTPADGLLIGGLRHRRLPARPLGLDRQCQCARPARPAERRAARHADPPGAAATRARRAARAQGSRWISSTQRTCSGLGSTSGRSRLTTTGS